MRKNFRSDISIREIFYDIDQTGERVQSMVPENVRVEYFTPAFPRVRFVCSRNGGIFHNCSLDDNGRTLVCNLPLSRKSLGVGPLLKIVKFSVSDESFPYDLRNREYIASTGIDLWGGPSDAGELESESVLSEVILRYGYSAYRLAVLDGFEGTEEEWLASLIGPQGLSAYQVAVAEGFEGSVSEWLASLTGPQGKSAYQVAVDNGFEGSVSEWLASLKGPAGDSAYQIAVDNGYVGTEEQWLASLHGEDGHSPYVGENGNWFEWDDDEEAYVDSGKPSRGPEGPRGPVVSAEDTGETVQPANLSPNVQYVAQELTSSQKAQARQNIGAGTSDFNGDYNDLDNKPDIAPLSTSVEDDKTSDAKSSTPKSVYDHVAAKIAANNQQFYTKAEIDEMLVSLKIPAEYQRVEYLQGDGTAYIDLGVNNKNTFGVRAKAGGFTTNVLNFVCGASTGNMRGVGVRIGRSSVSYNAAANENTIIFEPSNYRIAEQKYVQSNFYGSGKGFIEGAEDISTIDPLDVHAYGNTDYHFTLFGANNYLGTLWNNSPVSLYHFQLTDGDTLKFNLYPVYRKSDDEPGMYDIVTGTFFPNANSSGAFTVGPNA